MHFIESIEGIESCCHYLISKVTIKSNGLSLMSPSSVCNHKVVPPISELCAYAGTAVTRG